MTEETPEQSEECQQSEQQGHSYRLKQISLLKKQLEDEREAWASLYKNTIEELMSEIGSILLLYQLVLVWALAALAF